MRLSIFFALAKCIAIFAALGAGVVLMPAMASAATSKTSLNMRSGPGPGHGIVATIPAGSQVGLGNCSGRWCAVTFGGRQGFASRGLLAIPDTGVSENRRTLVPPLQRGAVRGQRPELDPYDYRPSYDRGPRSRFGYRPYGYDGYRGIGGRGRLGPPGLGSSSRGGLGSRNLR